jgi:hypothetical protein
VTTRDAAGCTADAAARPKQGTPALPCSIGATYNPIELERFGVRGAFTSVATARTWYEKAKQFGSVEVLQQLGLLAKRDH